MPFTFVHREPTAGAGGWRVPCGRVRGIGRSLWWHAVLLVHLLAGAASAGFAREVGGVAAPMPFEEREVEIPVGALRLPAVLFVPTDGAAARRPAIVLLHGCGGLRDAKGALALRHRDWAERLAGWGVVTLAPDSFTPRGPRSVCSLRERPAHPWRERSEDGYAALAMLAARPDVDPARILVLGWSHGGSTVTGPARPPHARCPTGLAHVHRATTGRHPVPHLITSAPIGVWRQAPLHSLAHRLPDQCSTWRPRWTAASTLPAP